MRNKSYTMEVFFYGLFMDEKLLSKKGIHTSNPRIGYLKDYALRIGSRASLIPRPNEKSYGVVMTLDKESVHKLYSEASVADYIPEELNIKTETNDIIQSICYNLPAESISGFNESYAHALFELAKRKGFPIEYLEKIQRMTQNSPRSTKTEN